MPAALTQHFFLWANVPQCQSCVWSCCKKAISSRMKTNSLYPSLLVRKSTLCITQTFFQALLWNVPQFHLKHDTHNTTINRNLWGYMNTKFLHTSLWLYRISHDMLARLLEVITLTMLGEKFITSWVQFSTVTRLLLKIEEMHRKFLTE
jgi:hypothetical protein